MQYEQKEWEERRSEHVLNRDDDDRTPCERDYARLIHSAGFRRLQAKTQVLGIGEGDFHRTRLTHSLEVAQIAKGIVKHLRKQADESQKKWCPSEVQVETISLAHDIGHPPFGHGGEVALNYVMREDNGFEGNGQTLRLISKLEAHTQDHGLDLTRRTLLGVVKYPGTYSSLKQSKSPPPSQDSIDVVANQWKPPKCIMDSERDVFEWILRPFPEEDKKKFLAFSAPSESEHGKTLHHALDTSIMEMADDIAYGVHDLEDGIVLRLVDNEDFKSLKKEYNEEWGKKVGYESFEDLQKDLFQFGDSHLRKRAIGGLVHAFIISSEWKNHSEFEHPLLCLNTSFSREASTFLKALKGLVISKIIKIPQVQTLEYRGQQLVIKLFKALASDPERLLKENFAKKYKLAPKGQESRVICDYIAGMTDEYATRMYERLFVPRQGNVFARL